jgi:hypothetical protein
VFSVLEENGSQYLGSTASFNIKPASYGAQIAGPGMVTNIRIDEDVSLFIQGQTPIPDGGCVIPLLFDQSGIVDWFPAGQCASIADGQWLMQIPADPNNTQAFLDLDSTYSVILLSDDLNIPLSAPFVIDLSPAGETDPEND